MAQVHHMFYISYKDQSTTTQKCNSECIDIKKESCAHTQDNDGLQQGTYSSTGIPVYEYQTSSNKIQSDAAASHDCENIDYSFAVHSDEKPHTVSSVSGLYKTDGTMITSALDIQHSSENEEFQPDTADEQAASFDDEDLSSDCGDDDDDFSYLSDANEDESEMPDTEDDGLLPKQISARNKFVKCPQCDKRVRKRDLNEHINVTHTKKNKYLCELCGDGFLSQSRLRRHKVAKHRVGCKYIKCEECPYKTPYISTFKRHVLSHQRKSSGYDQTMSHECIECGKILANPDSLRVHLNAHKNGKPFTCIKCAKSFAQKGNLKTHLVQHIKEEKKKRENIESNSKKRFYSCDQCDKVFRWSGDLCRHKKVVHLGIKKFVCGECGKRFTHKNQLDEHTLWHKDLTPFPCTVCHKSYRSKYRLKYHFMKCHEDSMYELDGILKDTQTSNINSSNTSSSPSNSKVNDD